MHIAASVHSAHQRQHTVYGTGSNLDRERTDVCEGGPKCSRYRYIFDYNDTRIVLSHQQKYFIFLYTTVLIKTVLWTSIQVHVYCKLCCTVCFNEILV